MKIYICSIKLIGMPFATASKERAEAWEAEDATHYFNEMELENL